MTKLGAPSPRQAIYKSRDPDVQPASQFNDIDEANVTLPALHTTYVVAVQISQFRQFLLRQMALLPKLSDAPSESDSRVGASHAVIIGV